MKICEKCGKSNFEFVAEDHYVRYEKTSINKGAQIVAIVLLWMLLLYLFFTIEDNDLSTGLSIIFSFACFGGIVGIFLKKTSVKYKEKRKTVAVCKECWQKYLLDDPKEQNEIEKKKLFPDYVPTIDKRYKLIDEEPIEETNKNIILKKPIIKK